MSSSEFLGDPEGMTVKVHLIPKHLRDSFSILVPSHQVHDNTWFNYKGTDYWVSRRGDHTVATSKEWDAYRVVVALENVPVGTLASGGRKEIEDKMSEMFNLYSGVVPSTIQSRQKTSLNGFGTSFEMTGIVIHPKESA